MQVKTRTLSCTRPGYSGIIGPREGEEAQGRRKEYVDDRAKCLRQQSKRSKTNEDKKPDRGQDLYEEPTRKNCMH